MDTTPRVGLLSRVSARIRDHMKSMPVFPCEKERIALAELMPDRAVPLWQRTRTVHTAKLGEPISRGEAGKVQMTSRSVVRIVQYSRRLDRTGRLCGLQEPDGACGILLAAGGATRAPF